MSHDQEKKLKILKRKLKEMARIKHLPPGMLDLLGKVRKAQLEAASQASLDLENIVTASLEAVAQGAPLLLRAMFPIDRTNSLKLALELAGLTKQGEDAMAEACAAAAAKFESEEGYYDRAVKAYLEGEDEIFAQFAQDHPKAPRALSFLVQSSLSPSIELTAAKLELLLDPEKAYLHGHCPVCGSEALMASLRGKEGRKFLTCSFCQHDYRAPRLQCPFCLEDNPTQLPFFESEEEPGYRAQVCNSCKMYIKTSDFRDFDRENLPIFDDLESLTLDILMAKQGYSRPTLSAWGF